MYHRPCDFWVKTVKQMLRKWQLYMFTPCRISFKLLLSYRALGFSINDPHARSAEAMLWVFFLFRDTHPQLLCPAPSYWVSVRKRNSTWAPCAFCSRNRRKRFLWGPCSFISHFSPRMEENGAWSNTRNRLPLQNIKSFKSDSIVFVLHPRPHSLRLKLSALNFYRLYSYKTHMRALTCSQYDNPSVSNNHFQQ